MAKRPVLNDVNSTTGLIGLGPLPSTAPVASFNLDQIENLVDTKGFIALHYRFALSPDRESMVGGVNPNSQEAQRNGRYYSVRAIKVIPQNFKLNDTLTVQGVYDTHDVLLNVSGNYADGDKEPVYIKPRDLIVMNPTITVSVNQLVEFNPNGPLSLNYQVKGVEYMASKHNEFVLDRDFAVVNGQIVWLPTGLKPNFLNGKGDILSLVYWITPIYLVRSLLHSLRVLPDNEFGLGGLPRDARYAPQLVVCQQSHLREEQNLLDFSALPPYAGWADSNNTTGGG